MNDYVKKYKPENINIIIDSYLNNEKEFERFKNNFYYVPHTSLKLTKWDKKFKEIYQDYLKEIKSMINNKDLFIPDSQDYLSEDEVNSLFDEENNELFYQEIATKHCQSIDKDFSNTDKFLLLKDFYAGDTKYFIEKALFFQQDKQLQEIDDDEKYYTFYPDINNLVKSYVSVIYKWFLDDINNGVHTSLIYDLNNNKIEYKQRKGR
ncbi:hypothetical protein VBM87_01415 [Mycoplasma sp. 744]|uniref:hypothetical protein n=1 Tax=Mycoplasma sp. 744 TaxID=3108531 RepID=UPI002B1CF6FB|nr:hypothetical protein [Mycoplasma sp. 744]MEA4115440.1 hypothetical protein [Mycoplasma sp. 744]